MTTNLSEAPGQSYVIVGVLLVIRAGTAEPRLNIDPKPTDATRAVDTERDLLLRNHRLRRRAGIGHVASPVQIDRMVFRMGACT